MYSLWQLFVKRIDSMLLLLVVLLMMFLLVYTTLVKLRTSLSDENLAKLERAIFSHFGGLERFEMQAMFLMILFGCLTVWALAIKFVVLFVSKA